MAQSFSRRVEARRLLSPRAGISTILPTVSIRRRNNSPNRLLGLMPKRAIRSDRSSRSTIFSTVQDFVRSAVSIRLSICRLHMRLMISLVELSPEKGMLGSTSE